MRFEVPEAGTRPPVSIVVPTAGASGEVDGSQRRYVEVLVAQVLEGMGPDDELLVVTGPEAPEGLERALRSAGGDDERLRIVRDAEPFSFSGRVNLGVEQGSAAVVLLLNDDTEVLGRGWIDRMVLAATAPGVAAVGATLLYEDATLQHGGLTTTDGLPTHAWAGWDPDSGIDGGILEADRFAWGVTGAVMVVTRATWEDLGGFSEEFPVNYNDVDFCCKASHVGLANVVLGTVRLRHFETRTRPRELAAAEVDRLRGRWAHLLGPDPLVEGTSALEDRRPSGDRSG